MREVGVKGEKDSTDDRKKGWRLMTRYPLRKMRALSIVVLALCLVWFLTGCELLSDIQDEMQAEELARKYGEELSRSELGPYRGFSRKEYFKHKCDTEAGEFIYRTVENVEGVFQMRPREPRDYFDRLRKKDIPEDPWGHTNTDARNPWSPFLRDFDYFEAKTPPGKKSSRWNHRHFKTPPIFGTGDYWFYFLDEPDGNEYFYKKKGEERTRPLVATNTSQLKSRYGYTWREVRNKYDRHFGVWGGEILVKELDTNEVLGLKRGFFDTGYEVCPKDKDVFFTFEFVAKVLIPKGGATQWRKRND